MATSTYNFVGSVIANGSSAQMTVSSLPQTDNDLVCTAMVRNNSWDYAWIYINGSLMGNAFDERMWFDTSGGSSTSGYASMLVPAGAGTEFTPIHIFISNYSSTSLHKSITFKWGNVINTPGYQGIGGITYKSTAAITSIGIGPNDGSAVLAGSKLSVWSLKKA